MFGFWWRWRRRARLFSLLYSLLLFRMPLLHLFGLLLVALLNLLPSGLVSVLFCELLVLFFLLAFEFLPIFLFLRV